MRVGTSLLASVSNAPTLRLRSALIAVFYRYVSGARASAALDTSMFTTNPTAAQQAALAAVLRQLWRA